MHPRIVEGIRLYPSFYYAGAVGPDGFPDITYGQRTIHPVDTGTFLARIFDMAWAAQTSPEYTEAERLQILAFAYGYATHATGDFFAHSLVNEFSEGVFPAVFDIVGGVPDGARELANGLRHLMMEDYFNQATPRFDANGERNLLPNGDISDDETPGIVFDAPTRFIYETLLKPFPDDPSARANTGRTFISVDTVTNPLSLFNGQLAFRRTDGGSFVQEEFEVGMLVHTFNFASAANSGKYRVLEVAEDYLVVARSFAAGPARLPARGRDRHR